MLHNHVYQGPGTAVLELMQLAGCVMNKTEKKSDRRRAEIVESVTQHLLQHGLQNSGIRALADSADTSDRMLMYYFGTKENLITEVVTAAAEGLSLRLDDMVPASNLSGKQLINSIVDAAEAPEVKPLLRFFFEMVGRAMRDEPPYKLVSINMLELWQLWVESKLKADQRHRAPEVVAELEGRLMINLLRGS